MSTQHTPESMIAAYAGAAPRYVKGRIGAARIHANDPQLTDAQRAYWLAIAEGLAKATGSAQ